ncbi:MAG: hypothetical protein JW395_0166 [Nitrospira sp.]|nr:hypothetical protein [Nitrospira sp.]
MTSLTIWANEHPPPPNSGQMALWQAFLPDDAPEGLFSIPDEVHRSRETLRTDYLAWLHGAGGGKVRGRSLVDRMAIRPGLSYWWMTIPADNSLESNSPAYVAVRLMALAALADRLGVTAVRIVGADRTTGRLLKQWARSSGRQASVSSKAKAHWTRESVYRAAPPLAALRVLLAHLSLPRRAKSKPQVSKTEGITFVDYLAHLGPAAVTEGRFDSNYWGPLVDVLDETDEPVHWVHISADLATGKVVDRDAKLVKRFNSNTSKQTHGLLNEHLTWGVLARSCRGYLRVCSFGIRVRNRTRVFSDSQSGVPLWQAFRAAYRDQFFGKTAALNCIWLNLCHEALANQPHQRLGIYLFENQPWELAFITAWRAAGHGELIGVAHSTTRFWDTRYFKDPRDMWSAEGDHPMPWPDRVAVNGPAMRAQCLSGGYPASLMADLEALRYLDIQHELPPPRSEGPIRILVCGEYSTDSAQRMLDVVNEALDGTDLSTATTYRPHPAYVGPKVRLHPSIRPDRHASVRAAIGASDFVISGASSSVAIEAVCIGRTSIVVADAQILLSNPVESTHGAILASSPRALTNALSVTSDITTMSSMLVGDVFHTSSGLVHWRTMLNGTTKL